MPVAGSRSGIRTTRSSRRWGRLSVGVEVEIDKVTGQTEVPDAVAGLALTLPVAVFLAVVWAVLLRRQVVRWVSAVVVAAVLVAVGAGLLPTGEYVVAAVVLAAVVVALEVDGVRRVRGRVEDRVG